jgi:hypothetical protein
MKKIIIASFAVVMLIVACKKSENENTGNLTLSTDNLAGKYKITAATATLASASIGLDIYDSILKKPCQKIATHTFTAAGVYTYSDMCDTVPYTTSNAYTIVQPDELNYGGRRYKVASLTTTQLIVGYDSFINPYGNTNFKLTLTKQP